MTWNYPNERLTAGVWNANECSLPTYPSAVPVNPDTIHPAVLHPTGVRIVTTLECEHAYRDFPQFVGLYVSLERHDGGVAMCKVTAVRPDHLAVTALVDGEDGEQVYYLPFSDIDTVFVL